MENHANTTVRQIATNCFSQQIESSVGRPIITQEGVTRVDGNPCTSKLTFEIRLKFIVLKITLCDMIRFVTMSVCTRQHGVTPHLIVNLHNHRRANFLISL